MTERGRIAIQRQASFLAIGPSSLAWDGNALTIDVNETTVPFPRRITGRVRVSPRALTHIAYPLEARDQHRWWPIAPCACVEVELSRPALRWIGDGYLDSNFGTSPLERSFVRWDWSRAATRRGATVLYDIACRDGRERVLALQFDESGRAEEFAAPKRRALPPSGWRLARHTRSEGAAHVIRTLENAPFYARSLIATRLRGEGVTAMHESLSLDRFDNPVVQLMLPFRMPRALSI
jgi:carotenoid 1,2-hydratase